MIRSAASRLRAVLPLLGAAVLVAVCTACGEIVPSDDGGAFIGRTYLSTSVTENGEPKPLVGGTQLTLTFTADGISATAGCNTMVAAGGIHDGVLVLDQLAGTDMGCEPAVLAQEQWWAQFLMANPAVNVGDRALTLRGPAAEVAMVSTETVPDLPLEGTDWSLETIIDGDVAASVPSGTESSLGIADGVLTVAVASCRSTAVDVVVSQTTLTFDPTGFAASDCTGGAASVDGALAEVFGSGEVAYRVDAEALTISSGGTELVYRGS